MHSVELVVVRLDRVQARPGLLSDEERARAARFRFERDRRRYIASRTLLRELIAARCGVAAGTVCIELGERGKPKLPHAELEFSLSRSGEMAAYAFRARGTVGVDIEIIRPLEEADAVAQRTFPSSEWKTYAALRGRDRLAGFFRGWTRTEALAKALGGGLALERTRLDQALHGSSMLESFSPAAGFAGAVAKS
ncbi:MAG TPA: 4'-phosphopantetheinyl transferase superfamily protein [Burkholderiales bacterium]|nr:4'-phosphopantetheinyl transferase superfamily protein [Burkholderiales bacterium]